MRWLGFVFRDPLLSREGEGQHTPFKTSIVFSLKEGPGQLFKALSVFALRDIDMTKIESRPMRRWASASEAVAGMCTLGDGQLTSHFKEAVSPLSGPQ